MSGGYKAKTTEGPISAQAVSISFARFGESSPAAIGKNGLLIWSTSTSYNWLMPTMKALPQSNATKPASARGTRPQDQHLARPPASPIALTTPANAASIVPRIVRSRELVEGAQ